MRVLRSPVPPLVLACVLMAAGGARPPHGHDSVSLDFRRDIGGFGASSNLIWGLVGAGRYWLPWTPMSLHPYLAAGYRAVAFDRASSEGNIQMLFRGPLGGAGFVF